MHLFVGVLCFVFDGLLLRCSVWCVCCCCLLCLFAVCCLCVLFGVVDVCVGAVVLYSLL